MDELCLGQLKVVPLAVTLLLMRRDGVVYHRADALIAQRGLQLIAIGSEYWEDVVHSSGWRKDNLLVLYLIDVSVGDVLSAGVVGMQISQLYREDGSRELVHA